MASIVSIKGLSVNYGAYKALHSVDLEVYADDFMGVIGPNGGGKTTLIKSILGLVEYSGNITYSPDIEHYNTRLIGYMPQLSNFDREFPISAREVVLSGLQIGRGFKKRYSKADKDRAAATLNLLGVSDISNKAISDLSGGQMQRVLLCRAIISNPKLLILDEPANFVDNKFEAELYDILKELNKRMAIIMVSHDMGAITSVVKSIVCVNKHVHRHNSNIITSEELQNYDCPIQLVYHAASRILH